MLRNDAAIKHTEVLVKLARDAAKKHGIEAFIMERPSRYDKKDVMKPRLNQVANGMLMPLTNILDNVHIIRLPSLDNLVGKAKKDLFKDDGIHLTDIGQTVLEDDMIAGIRSSYKDLKPKIQSSQRNNPPPTNNHSHRGGRERRVEYDGHPDGAHGRHHWDDSARKRGNHHSQNYRQQQHQGNGHRNNQRNDNRRGPGMQDMYRDFMDYMNNGPGMHRGSWRY